MRVLIYAASMLLALACASNGQRQFGPLDDEDVAFLLGALDGEYMLVGKRSSDDSTYSGRVILRHRGSELEVTRSIGEVTLAGRAVLQTVGADKNVVLVAQFVMDAEPQEATYLLRWDLDNDLRLTGYVYPASEAKRQKTPGLEALFPKKDT